MNKLSLIVITYQRDLDLVESIHSSITSLKDLLGEIIIVDNNNDGQDRARLFKNFSEINISIIDPKQNLGVAGGRNLGAEKAAYPFLLFFDDDAVFSDDFDLSQFKSHIKSNVMLASNTIRQNGNYAREEFPFFNKKRDRNLVQYSARFIGVAHLCSKELFFAFGGYDESSFYGMEEFYFSAWILSNGYSIKYIPDFKVIHKKSDSGRDAWINQSLRMFNNKINFLREWYIYPFFIILGLINLLFFTKAGMKFTKGLNVFSKSVFRRSSYSRKRTFADKIKFMKKQKNIKDYLI